MRPCKHTWPLRPSPPRGGWRQHPRVMAPCPRLLFYWPCFTQKQRVLVTRVGLTRRNQVSSRKMKALETYLRIWNKKHTLRLSVASSRNLASRWSTSSTFGGCGRNDFVESDASQRCSSSWWFGGCSVCGHEKRRENQRIMRKGG
jgi:hypothetical protein